MALAYWNIVLKDRFRFIELWCKFLTVRISLPIHCLLCITFFATLLRNTTRGQFPKTHGTSFLTLVTWLQTTWVIMTKKVSLSQKRPFSVLTHLYSRCMACFDWWFCGICEAVSARTEHYCITASLTSISLWLCRSLSSVWFTATTFTTFLFKSALFLCFAVLSFILHFTHLDPISLVTVL
jgi:hypothetical protein